MDWMLILKTAKTDHLLEVSIIKRMHTAIIVQAFFHHQYCPFLTPFLLYQPCKKINISTFKANHILNSLYSPAQTPSGLGAQLNNYSPITEILESKLIPTKFKRAATHPSHPYNNLDRQPA